MTDNEQKNGAGPRAMTEAEIRNLTLNNFCWPVIISGVNGIRVAMIDSGMFDVGSVLVRICGMMGTAIGGALSMGDIAPILRMRGDCIKAFTEGLRGVKIQAAPTDGPVSEVKLPRMQ